MDVSQGGSKNDGINSNVKHTIHGFEATSNSPSKMGGRAKPAKPISTSVKDISSQSSTAAWLSELAENIQVPVTIPSLV